MDSKYVYVKQRRDFGKQCIFEDIGPTVEENIFPDPALNKDYIYQQIIDKSTQKSKQFALHEVEAKAEKLKNSHVLHLEGSWPKEINPLDEEVVRRFRQRVTRSDNWISTMNPLMQVNEIVSLPEIEEVYSDQESNVRPVNHVSWSMDTYHLAVAYCFKNRIELPSNLSPNAYIWNIEQPNNPLVILKSASASVAIEFNPRDPFLLISGLMSGQVCSWDTRTSDSPVQISEALNSHRNPANQALWINSKTNTEFFSASNDGTVKWWDTRNLKRPTENLVMDLAHPERENINEATGVSALQYESTMGNRFLAGLENGIVVNVNRKAIAKTEKLHTRFYCHLGSVLTIDRHPGSLKNFLTVCDNHAKVWTEETKEHYLVQTGRKTLNFLTGACWSRSRWSFFFTIDTKGTLNAYDLFEGTVAPYYGLSISEKPLTTIKPHDDGKILAVGGSDGKVYLIACEGLCTTTFPNDKYFFSSYLDRCSQYQKLVESRRKEIGLVVASIPVPSTMESAPLTSKDKHKDKSKDRDKSKERDTKEKIRLKEQEKQKEIQRKSRRKKSTNRDSPFAVDDTEILEAEKHYFLTMTMEQESYKSEESKEIERLHNIYLKAKQAKLETQGIDFYKGVQLHDEKSRRKPRPRRLKGWARSTSRDKISDSLKEMGAKLEVESVKSEEFVKKKKGRKRRAISETPLKICPMRVCEPEVCCADIVKKEKERKILLEEKELKKKKLTRFIESSEDILIPLQKVSSIDWQKKILETSKSVPERTEVQKRRILLGKDAPPDVLTEDVKVAKKYFETWRDSLVGKSSFHRSLSMPLTRRLKDEKDSDKKEYNIAKEKADVHELTNEISRNMIPSNVESTTTEETKRNKKEEEELSLVKTVSEIECRHYYENVDFVQQAELSKREP
ncbi:hypothetical protein M0802_006990 [Mischocyttarus mexicanus]|nr:hypothetical protein M0802_006990 [Mischocyttarus mexicanus]